MTANGKTIGENNRGPQDRRPGRDHADRDADARGRRLHHAQGQPVRQCRDEDQRDLEGIRRPLPVEPERSRAPSRAAPSCSRGRRTTTTASTIPALEIDEHCLLFIRGTGPIGYPGGAEVVNMQPPGGAHQEGHPLAALHRRRPPVRHLGLALDPQRLAGSGGGRRPGAAARPATGCASTCTSARANIMISDAELNERRAALQGHGGFNYRRQPDALAGDPALHGRPVRRGHGAEAGGEVPARRPDHGRAARQPLRERAAAQASSS